MNMNRLATTQNMYQNMRKFPRVLTVCSAGLLRSPTAAWVLSMDPYNCNTRAAGSNWEYGLVQVDEYLCAWADEFVFMEQRHLDAVRGKFPDFDLNGMHPVRKPVFVLGVPDQFEYRSPDLVQALTEAFDAVDPPGYATRNP
jgi:predicted protein tyrosine phosphatase